MKDRDFPIAVAEDINALAAALTKKQDTIGVAIVQHKKPANQNSGTFYSGNDSGKWGRLMPLNSISKNDFATLARNQITLQPGTYSIMANKEAYRTNRTVIALVKSGTKELLLTGIKGYAVYNATLSLQGQIALTEATTLELRGWAERQQGTFGQGMGKSHHSLTESIFTQITIEKLA